jgi:rhombotail lipoprotein
MKATSVLFACLLLTGCAGLFGQGNREGVSSSLVDYLYPDGEKPPEQTAVTPNLELPLTVGIAFVPTYGNAALSEAERMNLLNKVKSHFEGREYIREIAVIPEAYMRSGRGFQSLEQVARLYNLHVVALVSYDQVAHTDERTSSFLYWTIVGAYVVKGNENDVNTFVDTAVFDVASNKLLFRAPGVSDITSSTTYVEMDADRRATQQKGFEQAMADMTVNLDKELDVFKERIREDQSVRISYTPSYRSSGGSGGGGTSGIVALTVLALLIGIRRRQN